MVGQHILFWLFVFQVADGIYQHVDVREEGKGVFALVCVKVTT